MSKLKRTPYKPETVRIVAGMAPWRRSQGTLDTATRTDEQRAFDGGIMAASEFIRRFTGDETLAIQIHALLTPTMVDSIGLPIHTDASKLKDTP